MRVGEDAYMIKLCAFEVVLEVGEVSVRLAREAGYDRGPQRCVWQELAYYLRKAFHM